MISPLVFLALTAVFSAFDIVGFWKKFLER